MIDEDTLRRAEDVPGYCGPLADDRPRVTHPRVRPFVWAIALVSTGVRREELLASMGHLFPTSDLRVGEVSDALGGNWDDDRSRLELVVDEVLGEMVAEGLLRYREDGLYVLTLASLKKAISIVCTLNAQLPDHLLNEQVMAKLPAPF